MPGFGPRLPVDLPVDLVVVFFAPVLAEVVLLFDPAGRPRFLGVVFAAAGFPVVVFDLLDVTF